MTTPPGAGARNPATARQTPMMCLAQALGHQRWIHYGIRFRLARLLLASDIRTRREFEVAFFGLRYRGNIASFIDWSVFVFGAYERGLLQFLADAAHALAGDDAVYVDIGANVGQHALYMSHHTTTVHAFEPYEPVRRRIEEKIADNRLGNILVHPVGLGAADAGLPFYAPVSFNQGQGTFLPGIVGTGGAPVGELQVARADAWFPAHGIDRVDLIKIDVEGFEPNVLRGMRAVIERHRPVIVMGSPIKRKVCNSPRFRPSHAIGRPRTTGASAKPS